ncbi:MAG TPA: hypothetical protein VF833_05835 [Gaiellaceae bacterium]
MTRRTLDLILAGGGLMVVVLLVALGFAVGTQYSFSTNYVKEELSAQKITFTSSDKLTDEEKNWKAGSSCLTTYGGQLMQTGAQAECYARYYIALHMDSAAKAAGFDGATYATLGTIRTGLSADVTAAKAKGDAAAAADAQKKLDSATALRATMQTGETLRGLLLTVYGFSVLGDMAGLASNLLYGLAAILLLIAAAGFVHAFVTPKEKAVFTPRGVVIKAPRPA